MAELDWNGYKLVVRHALRHITIWTLRQGQAAPGALNGNLPCAGISPAPWFVQVDLHKEVVLNGHFPLANDLIDGNWSL